MWSLGMTLLEILNLNLPFTNQNAIEFLRNTEYLTNQSQIPETLRPFWKDILS